jgi:hypothetical protein
MSTNKPARAAAKPTNLKPVSDGEPKPRKPRASSGGDFNAELRALADKHRKRSSKLRTGVAKLEQKLATMRAQLEAADEPLRKIERVLADRPELPGLADPAALTEPAPEGPSVVGYIAPDQPGHANGTGVSP